MTYFFSPTTTSAVDVATVASGEKDRKQSQHEDQDAAFDKDSKNQESILPAPGLGDLIDQSHNTLYQSIYYC